MTKRAVSSYGELEQNIGGVETLFGSEADKVIQKANEAYKTAGLSANDYMQTVTSFSASLLQSLGGDTKAAAEVADRAIIDMSDNANKMGTSMESIQNAYNGFAKQNYTMLDNLKLGYGGTKEEMSRLIADAAKMTDVQNELGVAVDATDMSFGNIVNAISVVQKQIGITGTTSKEAADTITGSMASAKAAWDNFLNGQGTVEEFTSQITGAVGNLAKSAAKIVPRLAEGLNQILIELTPYITPMIEELLPAFITGATALLNGFIAALPTIIPIISDAVLMIISNIGTAITDNLPLIVESLLQIGNQLSETFMQMLPTLLEIAAVLLITLAQGLGDALPTLIPAIVDIVLNIASYLIDNIDVLIDASLTLIEGLAQGLLDALPVLIEKAPVLIEKLAVKIIENAPRILATAITLILALANGLIQAIPELVKAIPRIINAVVNKFRELLPEFKEVGKQLIDGLWNGIKSSWSALKESVTSLANGLISTVKNIFGIHSPSKVFRAIGEYCIEGFDEPMAEYDPYETLNRNIQASEMTLRSSYVGTTGNMAGIDLSTLGTHLKNALNGMSVTMDGRKVGVLVASTVNSELGKFSARRV